MATTADDLATIISGTVASYVADNDALRIQNERLRFEKNHPTVIQMIYDAGYWPHASIGPDVHWIEQVVATGITSRPETMLQVMLNAGAARGLENEALGLLRDELHRFQQENSRLALLAPPTFTPAVPPYAASVHVVQDVFIRFLRQDCIWYPMRTLDFEGLVVWAVPSDEDEHAELNAGAPDWSLFLSTSVHAMKRYLAEF